MDELEDQIDQLFDVVPVPLIVANDTHLVRCSRWLAKFLGRSMQDMLKTPWLHLIHEEDRPESLAVASRSDRDSPVYGFVCRLLDSTGIGHKFEWDASQWSGDLVFCVGGLVVV